MILLSHLAGVLSARCLRNQAMKDQGHTEAFNEGVDAFWSDRPYLDNPHPPGFKRRMWSFGWKTARREVEYPELIPIAAEEVEDDEKD